MKKTFDFNDIQIVPSTLSTIQSRSECNIFDEHEMLPIITAPMFGVIDSSNVTEFKNNKIYSILPRTLNQDGKNFDFKAFGLNDKIDVNDGCGILIDIANGHMESLLLKIKEIKKQFPTSKLMVGNIGNPQTFRHLAEAGADFIRVGIGGGSMCLTTTHTGIGFPLASLIKETYEVKQMFNLKAKIVADGGISTYSDIIKALALGADYCMLGNIFAKAEESTAEKYVKLTSGSYINLADSFVFDDTDGNVYAKYFGMASKEAQKQMKNEKLKTSEGTVRYISVEYTLSRWVENFKDYLRSAMSYTNSRNLEEFKDQEFIMISQEAIKRISK